MSDQKYPELYSYLNPHLFVPDASPSKDVKEVLIDFVYPSFATFSVSRDPPRIHGLEKDLKKRFSGQFSDAIFGPHTVRYLKAFLVTQIAEKNRTSLLSEDRKAPPPLLCCTKKTFFHAKTLWAHNYYHFITETIPAILWFLEHAETKDPEKATIICHSTPFSAQALEWFGIRNPTRDSYPDAEEDSSSLWVIHSQPINECGAPSLEKYKLLRDRCNLQLRKEGRENSKKIGIVIKRDGGGSRNILNHEEMLGWLRSRFAETEWAVFDATIPFHLAAELFFRASVVIGAHGAGLTNTIFCPPGTVVIEYMPLSLPNLCYWHQSEMLGHIHHIVPCKDEGNRAMRVDIRQLEMIINKEA